MKESNDPDYTILIHRTSKRKREECFEQGLPIAEGNELNYTTDRYGDDMMALLVNVAGAAGYKSGWSKEDDARCVIMKIPNTSLEYIEGKTKPILYQTDIEAEESGGWVAGRQGRFQTLLLPEYILGTVEFEHGKMTEFVNNPNYTQIHDYKNDGLVCPAETIESYRKQKGLNNVNMNMSIENAVKKVYEMEKQEIFISKIIADENDKYMLQHPEEYQKYETKRTEADIKQFSKKEMVLSKFNEVAKKIKNFFTKDKNKEENSQNVDK